MVFQYFKDLFQKVGNGYYRNTHTHTVYYITGNNPLSNIFTGNAQKVKMGAI